MRGEWVSVGVDIIEIERIARTLARFGERFLRRVYTEAEIAYCRGKPSRLAARFAAKEAVAKALGVGIFWREGVYWRDVEVTRDHRGKPGICLHGSALERAQQEMLSGWALSLSHSREYAVAMVVATREERVKDSPSVEASL
jgi:holo-[acyl-carrier protein] synthase